MKNLLTLLLCLLSVISYSQDKITLNYNTTLKKDTQTNIEYVKIVPSEINIEDNNLSLTFNDYTMHYTILINTYYYLETSKKVPYVTYQMINNETGAIVKCYHIKNDFILEEGYNIFTFYNN